MKGDPRVKGFPKGHPVIKTCLGIPFLDGKEVIGLLGIANRPQGYDEGVIAYLRPFINVASMLIKDMRFQKEKSDLLRKLQIKTDTLTEHNAALKILLEERTELEKEIEGRIKFKVKNSIVPQLDDLLVVLQDDRFQAAIKRLKGDLTSLTDKRHFSDREYRLDLTPKEFRIAELIKQGKTSKEIAAILHISVRTVEFHRKQRLSTCLNQLTE